VIGKHSGLIWIHHNPAPSGESLFGQPKRSNLSHPTGVDKRVVSGKESHNTLKDCAN
jgi:hypothetical protein